MTFPLIDIHCHLNHDGLREDIEGAVQRARAVGVIHVVIVSYDLSSSLEAVTIAEKLGAFASAVVGIHPTMAHTCNRDALTVLEQLAMHPKVVGIGETGLDLHYAMPPMQVQLQALHAQLELASRHSLPVVFHCRDAYPPLLAELKRYTPLGGVMHCWAGTPQEAQHSVELGLHLGFGGVATYKSAANVHQSAAECPLDRLVLETDAPYLAPVPQRGKPNEPSYIAYTAARLAELRGISAESLAHGTTQSAMTLYPRIAPMVQAALRG